MALSEEGYIVFTYIVPGNVYKIYNRKLNKQLAKGRLKMGGHPYHLYYKIIMKL